MRVQRTHPKIAFAALSLLFFLASAGTFSSLGVVLPSMVRELHWSWAQAGMGYTVLGLACGLASFAPAILIRRIGVRGAVLCGTLLFVVGFTMLARTRSAGVYLIATLLIGVAFALTTTVPGTHVLTDLFKRRSTVLGAYFTIGALGGVAGPLLFVALQVLAQGWRVYWVVLVVGSALFGAFAVVCTPGRRARTDDLLTPDPSGLSALIEGPRDWTVRRALSAGQFYVIVGAYTMYLLINTTGHGFAVEHLTERGVDPKIAAGMLSLEALIGAGVSVIGGLAGEKFSPKTLLIIAMVALIIGMAALAEARGYALMLVYAIGMGISFGLTFLASTMLLLDYFGKRANLELYSLMCLISTSAAFGPALGGWSRDTFGGFVGLFLVCAAAALIMFVATCFMTPPIIAGDRMNGDRLAEAP